MINNLEVVFGSGGDIGVQCGGFAHVYDNAKQAAEDVFALLKSEDPSDWDNNEPPVEWTYEELRNGAVRVYVGEELLAGIRANAWRNETDFFAALGALRNE